MHLLFLRYYFNLVNHLNWDVCSFFYTSGFGLLVCCQCILCHSLQEIDVCNLVSCQYLFLVLEWGRNLPLRMNWNMFSSRLSCRRTGKELLIIVFQCFVDVKSKGVWVWTFLCIVFIKLFVQFLSRLLNHSLSSRGSFGGLCSRNLSLLLSYRSGWHISSNYNSIIIILISVYLFLYSCIYCFISVSSQPMVLY